MFFHLLYIHLFRYFLRYDPEKTPLPSNVAPRKNCTHAAAMISRLLRLYKRSYGLRQICNIVVYILHSACTIHLLNLPDQNAKRDILHGVRQLEEISLGWLVARRTLRTLALQAKQWDIEVPVEAAIILNRYYEQSEQHSRSNTAGASERGKLESSGEREMSDHEPWTGQQSTWDVKDNAMKYEFDTTDLDLWAAGNDQWDATTMPPFDETTQAFEQYFAVDDNNGPRADSGLEDFATYGGPGPYADRQGQEAPPNSPGENKTYKPQYLAGTNDSMQASFWQQQMQQFLQYQQQRQALQERGAQMYNGPAASTSGESKPFGGVPALESLSAASTTAGQSYLQMPLDQASVAQQAPAQPFRASGIAEIPRPSSAPQQPRVRTATKRPQASKRSTMAPDMFGGVQALLREGADWWVEDQTQVATGFGKWNRNA